jgi:hypothetical protein
MSSQPNNLDKHLRLLKNLPQASPSDGFEERLFSRLEEEEPEIKLPAASRWINWSVAALIALAITNVFVLTQQSTGTEEIDMLLVETVDEDYYYGQELLAIDEP